MADNPANEGQPQVDFEIEELQGELEEVSGGACANSGCSTCKEPPPVG